MHILFLTDNFPPEVNAPATRTFEHCREWASAGHKVTIITCAPNFPKGQLFPGYKNRLLEREAMAGIEVLRVWTYIAANEGFFRRTIDYLSFLSAIVPAILVVRKVDVIVATSPQLFTALAGSIISRLKRRPYIFELRDLWPESIRVVGAIKNERVFRLLEKLELSLYRHATAIISVTHSFVENLESRGVAKEKMHVITNGADLSRFHRMPRDETLSNRLGLEGKFVVGYIGTHGMAHGLSTLLEAATLLKDDPETHHVSMLFLGDGAEKSMLIAKAQESNLNNVIFLDTVPRDEVASYWSLLNVSIIHLKRTPLFETVIPSKLFECMAMGIPVLLGVGGEAAGIVARENSGLFFEPENADALYRSIRRFVLDPEFLQAFAESSQAAARKYDRKQLAAEMLNILESVRLGKN